MKRVLVYLGWILTAAISCSLTAELYGYLVHYPASLGPRFYRLFYTPYDLLQWFAYTHETNPLINQVLWALWAQLALWTLVWAFALVRIIKKEGNTFGTARMLRTSELVRLGAFRKGNVVLGQTDEADFKARLRTKTDDKTGTTTTVEHFTQTRSGRVIYNSEPTHYLVVASTRSGKGLTIVIPTLRQFQGAAVIYDIKKENWDNTSRHRSTFNDVLRFEPQSETSVRWNPLFQIRPGKREIADAQMIGQMLQSLSTKEKDEDYWALSSGQLIAGFILFLLYHPLKKEKSLYGVYRLMNDPAVTREAVLQEMIDFPTEDLNQLEQQSVEAFKIIARGALGMSPNERSGVFGTSNAKLQGFTSPDVRRATSASDFTIESLVYEDRPKSLYIVVAPGDEERLRPLTRLLLLFIGQRLTLDSVELVKKRHSLLFLIDEFPSLGRLGFIEKQIAYFAGYKIQLMLIVQSFNQLYDTYGERTSIPDNCRVKVILGVETYKEAKEVSDYLGVSTVIRQSKGKSQNTNQTFEGSTSEGLSEGARQLLTPDEVYRLPYTHLILLWTRQFPYIARKIFSPQDPRFSDSLKRLEAIPDPNQVAVQKRFLSQEKNPWAFVLLRPYNHAPPEEQGKGFGKVIELDPESEVFGNDFSIMEDKE